MLLGCIVRYSTSYTLYRLNHNHNHYHRYSFFQTHDSLSPTNEKDPILDQDRINSESMFSISYDPLEMPNQKSLERDLEDFLMERSNRFYDSNLVRNRERCYLVGLEDKSASDRNERTRFSLEESLTELSELSGAAGLSVVGTTYQRLAQPNAEYYIGAGKTKEIIRAMDRLKCTCVVFDAELTPSQQKNLELAFNEGEKKSSNKKKDLIKVIDRTALILDIFAQHAKTKEGQLQVQLALLTYRLPRLTNMWSHLERQTASSRGKSNGGVGLRGPGEKQLESDRRQMKSKIALLTRAIDSVRRHRSMHRRRRRRLGIPVIALVGYTNSGKSTLLNAFTQGGVFVADMLFATLDPTTRLVNLPSKTSSSRTPEMLFTDTVGFIQKLPTNLVAAFRATLEEIEEADVLLHVTDISNEAWKKQEASVLKELGSMGLGHKPVITVWNKIDTIPERKEYVRLMATKRSNTIALSATTGEGFDDLLTCIERSVTATMLDIRCFVSYEEMQLVSVMHRLGSLTNVQYLGDYIFVEGKVPLFLYEQIVTMAADDEQEDTEDERVTLKMLDECDLDLEAGEEDNESDSSRQRGGLFMSYDNDNDDNNYESLPEESSGNKNRRILLVGKELAGESSVHNLLQELLATNTPTDEYDENGEVVNRSDDDGIDWVALAKGRHDAVKKNQII